MADASEIDNFGRPKSNSEPLHAPAPNENNINEIAKKLDKSRLTETDGFNSYDTYDITRRTPNLTRNRHHTGENRRTKSLYGVSPNCKFGPCGTILDSSDTSLTIPDPGSQKLNWKKPPLTVLVVKKMYDEHALTAFKQLVCWLIEVKKMIVYAEIKVLQDAIADEKFQKLKQRIQSFQEGVDDLTNKVDFAICLGGDGTLLYAASLFQSSMPPVMAFNLGSLGFLTPFNFSNFKEHVTHVLEGNVSLLLRYRLKCVINKQESIISQINDKEKSTNNVKPHILVFNEVAIDRGHSPFLSNIDLYVEGKLVTSVQGDGLIISTPTGSTAYAVAAGASMVHPNVPAIVITPICPHSLSFRPIVVPAGVEIKIMVSPEARHTCWVSFDGRNRQEMCQGESIKITTAQYPVPSICSKDQMDDWFESLAECLHWNVRKPQKMFSSLTSSASVTSLDSNDLSS